MLLSGPRDRDEVEALGMRLLAVLRERVPELAACVQQVAHRAATELILQPQDEPQAQRP